MSTTESFAQEIRETTRPLHAAAEQHPFQARLAKGAISLDELAKFLGQMLHLHRTLTPALKALREARLEVAPLVQDRHFQDNRIEIDLRDLGHTPQEFPVLQGCQAFQMEIAQAKAENSLRLIGFHYVLEGSNNGARFLAKGLRRALGLSDSMLRYFDPHGEEQPQVWKAFKTDLDDLASRLSAEECDQIRQGVKDMYAGFGAISDDIVTTES